MKRLIIDVMGGDKAPLEMVKGLGLAMSELGDDVEYTVVGDKAQIEAIAKENNIDLSKVKIVHTETYITMDDDPVSVVRAKKDSSMGIGLTMLKDGEGDAFVTTGNTGAVFTGANLIVRKLKGVRRPALAALVPLQNPVLVVDTGANVVAEPSYLEHFAIMGSAYMKHVVGIENPRVGLLNNGAEEHKGTELQIETYKRLSANKNINFVGNIEGNTASKNTCDVLVTDGFAGNIFVKTVEGLGKMMLRALKDVFYKNTRTKVSALLIKGEINGIKKAFDPSEVGGAPILGIKKPVIKSHGSSDAKTFKNAIKQAYAYSNACIEPLIEETLANLKASESEE